MKRVSAHSRKTKRVSQAKAAVRVKTRPSVKVVHVLTPSVRGRPAATFVSKKSFERTLARSIQKNRDILRALAKW